VSIDFGRITMRIVMPVMTVPITQRPRGVGSPRSNFCTNVVNITLP